jgi:undecaprenyl-diphosphatase
MGWYIILGTIPIGIFGLIFRHQIKSGGRDLYLIATALIVMGLVLLVAERVSTRERGIDDLTQRDGVSMGLAQALALVPGVSRSGVTISTGLFLGLDRPAAARFSFLLSVPAVVLSGLFELKDFVGGDDSTSVPGLVLATLLAFVVGYASIAFLLRYLVSHSTYVFVAYRVVLGCVVLALVAAGVIS